MGTVRRLAAGLVVALPLLLALPDRATAAIAPHGPPAPPAGETLIVTGAFVATGTLETLGCPVFHQIVDGDSDPEWTALGVTSFVLDFCLGNDRGDGHWPAVGTFTVTTAEGTMAGDLGGTVEAGGLGPEFPLHLVLTVTGGTGRFAGATGSIAMEGAFGFAAFTAHGTVDGTVTLPPTTPKRIADCLHGGWRNVVDDQGRPFRGPGHCILWVLRHVRR